MFFSINQFQKSLNNIQKAHPTISEITDNKRPEDIRRFISHLKTCHENNFNSWIHKLDTQELYLIFPSIIKIEDPLSLDRLTKIVRERPSWNLYAQGWYTLQNFFTNQKVFLTLQLLIANLLQTPNLYATRPSFINEDICELIKEANYPKDFFNSLYLLFSNLSWENLQDKAKKIGLSLNSNLGIYLISRYLLDCEQKDLLLAKDYINEAMLLNNAIYSTKLIYRIINDLWLSMEDRLNLLLKINEHFSALDPIHPLWETLDRPLVRQFKEFILYYKLDIHTSKIENNNENIELSNHRLDEQAQQIKHKLYKDLIPFIDDVKFYSEIILIKIKDTLIIENKKTPFTLYYYSSLSLKRGFAQGYEIEDFANPQFNLPILENLSISSLKEVDYARLPLNETSYPWLSKLLISHFS